MIKKLDKFVLSRFMGPFLLAYAVVTFIFLIQHLIRYFKHFVGKDLGFFTFIELFSYFALTLTPIALPLAVLLSALMSFGSLGEHSELTAIKSSGTSLLRILRPVGIFVIFLTFGALYFNDVISPEANLKSYSLLYDIKQKKPTLEFKAGEFYDGLPGYSIRIDGKSGEDGQELEGLMIYNHTARQGNTDLIIAERGRMYTIDDGNYLILEMINGKRYTDISTERGRKHEEEFLANEFDSSKIAFNMESFGMKETKKELFKGHNMMKTVNQLIEERDSLNDLRSDALEGLAPKSKAYYLYQFKEDNQKAIEKSKAHNAARDSIAKGKQPKFVDNITINDSIIVNDSIQRRQPKQIREKISLSVPKNTNELEQYLDRKGLPPSEKDIIEEALLKQEEANQSTIPKKDSTKKTLATGITQTKISSTGQLQGLDSANYKHAIQPNSHGVQSLRQRQAPKKLSSPNTKGIGNKSLGSLSKIEPIKEKIIHIRNQNTYRILNLAWSKANGVKISAEDVQRRVNRHDTDIVRQRVELHNRYARSLVVFIMFLIGAPLGAIIKKGGLGVPILISILFFILYYITNITGTKLANSGVVSVFVGCWGPDIFLLSFGLFFLKQAYQDSRLLDFDYYSVAFDKVKHWLSKKTGKRAS